jgi:hypothetical protein
LFGIGADALELAAEARGGAARQRTPKRRREHATL